MTTRQIASVLLSCVLFGHGLPSIAIGAAAVVFSVLMVRSYRSSVGDATKKSKLIEEGKTASETTSEYPTGQSAGAGSSQISSAFGLAKGFASKYSSKAAALTGKLSR